VSQKRFFLYFLNDSIKTEPISIIFGVQCSEKFSHQEIINSPTSPQ